MNSNDDELDSALRRHGLTESMFTILSYLFAYPKTTLTDTVHTLSRNNPHGLLTQTETKNTIKQLIDARMIDQSDHENIRLNIRGLSSYEAIKIDLMGEEFINTYGEIVYGGDTVTLTFNDSDLLEETAKEVKELAEEQGHRLVDEVGPIAVESWKWNNLREFSHGFRKTMSFSPSPKWTQST